MSFLKKLKTAIVISRPASWIFGPAAYLLGLVIGGDEFTLLNVVQILLLSFPLGFYMCGINDAYDIKTDRINKRKGNALWGANITEKDVAWIKQASLLVVVLIFLAHVDISCVGVIEIVCVVDFQNDCVSCIWVV